MLPPLGDDEETPSPEKLTTPIFMGVPAVPLPEFNFQLDTLTPITT